MAFLGRGSGKRLGQMEKEKEFVTDSRLFGTAGLDAIWMEKPTNSQFFPPFSSIS